MLYLALYLYFAGAVVSYAYAVKVAPERRNRDHAYLACIWPVMVAATVTVYVLVYIYQEICE